MNGDESKTGRPVHERVTDQFSYRGEGAEMWRAFDRFLDTDAYLNLGYSPWYLPHFVGSSQRRLAEFVGDGLADRLGETAGRRLLDVGCGRGGPATTLANVYGFDVTGVDLVPYNVEAARRTATGADADGGSEDGRTGFVVGDSTRLPITTGSVDAATAIDSTVYVPEVRAIYGELARVLRQGGAVAISDLFVRDDLDGTERASVDAFADTWDMPGIVPVGRALDEVPAVGLSVDEVRDLSPHSVGRFRKWTTLYLAIAERRPGLTARALGRWDLDAERITEQVRTAHAALPHLRHVLVYARKENQPRSPQRSRPSSS